MTCKPVRPETVARHIRRADLVLPAEIVVETDPAAPILAPDAIVVAATGWGRPVLIRVGGNVEDGGQVTDQLRDALEAEDYEVTRSEHSPWRAFYVVRECEGHESLRGDAMGASLFCDGSIR